MADINSIISQLRQERDRIDHAISVLEGGRSTRKPSNGRRKRKRRLSATARKRISEAAKARWAKAKKAGRNSL